MKKQQRSRRSWGLWPIVIPLTLAISFAIAVLSWPSVQEESGGPTPPQATTPSSSTPSPTESTPKPPPPEPAIFTIGAVGDVLPHDTPIRVSHQGGNDYDFTPLIESTRAWSEGVDLAICNMEVPLALPGESPSGYPRFGAPEQIVKNLAGLGWNGCSTGTNHTLDRGATNAEYTLDVFDEHGLGHVGSARSQEEEDTPQLYELDREGQTITVAQIGATFGTNGLPIPADKPWVVSLLNAERILQRAQIAHDLGADLVIATLHWGNEYQLAAAESQKALAAELAESELIDLVIGTHPHVPQEFAKLDGGPGGQGMWVAYSLGNFISNQDSNCCIPETATGLFLTVTVEKEVDGPALITGMEWTPMTVDRLGDNTAYPLLDLLNERPDNLTLSPEVLEDRLARVQSVMDASHGAEFSMRTSPPSPTGPEPRVIPRSP